MKDDLKKDLAQSPYYSIYIDGSTDNTVVERELMYISFLHEGTPIMKFLSIKDVAHAHALGITEVINNTLDEFINQDKCSMVGFCSDGAAVNMGHRNGVATHLKNAEPPRPWLVVIHCQSHRLELAAKDAFKNTGMDNVIDMLNSMYSLFSRSPKRWRELQSVSRTINK